MIASGVNLIPEASVGYIAELGQEAERLGYNRCWVYDEGLATRDVYVTLTAIAQKNSRDSVGDRHYQRLHPPPGCNRRQHCYPG